MLLGVAQYNELFMTWTRRVKRHAVKVKISLILIWSVRKNIRKNARSFNRQPHF